MICGQIVSRETIRARARRHFAAGRCRDSHEMNPSEALKDWLAEYDRLAAEQRHDELLARRNSP